MIDLYPTSINLPTANHYGLPYTPEEVALHEAVMPKPPTSVAEFALRYGLKALFLP